MDISTTLTLNNGVRMPIFGFGTYLMKPGHETYQAVRWALEAGYRLIDTAAYYQNEKDVGEAIKGSGIPRKEIFVTTKLAVNEHGNPEEAFYRSLKKLNTEYIDLYLIHWPVEKLRNASWRVLEKLPQDVCRSIGVSNYTIDHLKELLAIAKVVPVVNQVEFHPFLYQKELYEFCREKGILLEAYSPLARGHNLDNPVVGKIARKCDKTPAQVFLRWGIQHDLVIIPKSKTKERIYENADIFDFKISSADMARIDKLNQNCHHAWNPHILKL